MRKKDGVLKIGIFVAMEEGRMVAEGKGLEFVGGNEGTEGGS